MVNLVNTKSKLRVCSVIWTSTLINSCASLLIEVSVSGGTKQWSIMTYGIYLLVLESD